MKTSKVVDPARRQKQGLSPFQCLEALYDGQHNAKVQATDYSSEDRTLPSSHVSWVAYRVLWLSILRRFLEMDGQALRKDTGKRGTWKLRLQLQ